MLQATYETLAEVAAGVIPLRYRPLGRGGAVMMDDVVDVVREEEAVAVVYRDGGVLPPEEGMAELCAVGGDEFPCQPA